VAWRDTVRLGPGLRAVAPASVDMPKNLPSAWMAGMRVVMGMAGFSGAGEGVVEAPGIARRDGWIEAVAEIRVLGAAAVPRPPTGVYGELHEIG